MLLILKLSLRNLFRSKRRTLLLGAGIALGFMILIIADSFSQGISDILLNRVVINFTGHIEIMGIEKAGRDKFIIRDKPFFKKAVTETLNSPRFKRKIARDLGGLRTIRGNAFLFTTGIGTKSTQVMLMGRPPDPRFLKSLTVVEGDPLKFGDPSIPDPAIISKSKAKQLGIRVRDTFRAMFQTIYGQFQTANFTVVALTGGSDIFSKGVGYARLKDLKQLLGYRDWETGSLQVIFKRVRNKKLLHALADSIYKKLTPYLAVISGELIRPRKHIKIEILPFKRTPASIKKLSELSGMNKGSLANMKEENSILISDTLLQDLNLKKGDQVVVRFQRKYIKYPLTVTLSIAGRIPSKIVEGKNIALMHEDQFYQLYYDNLPENYTFAPQWLKDSPLKKIIGKSWILLPRDTGETDIKEELAKINRMDTSSLIMSVRTMDETAGDIIKMEVALKSVTLVGVAILFLIVLIGVVNSLRMSIKERTREIGTIRATGATGEFVLLLFLGEIFWLTVISAAAGLILAFITMKIIAGINFHVTGPFSLLFPEGHIHFLPTASNITINFLLLLIISLLAAYFPARSAAKMPPSEALRHYE